MSEAIAKLGPTLRGEERTWFEAAAEGRLLIQRCGTCGAAVFFPRSVCPVCHDDALEWADAAGTGTVYSYTVLHRAGKPGWEADVPYVVALIELDEGPRLMGNLLEVELPQVRIGMPVRVTFEQRDALTVPQWVPA
ncbi:MAG: Zn-ribbon domain-containing OB-fold protein [Actinobacteria bacterium]|nr:Zn-ribbon domain-containing OB-fold protein [Actinomycetota bacterium]